VSRPRSSSARQTFTIYSADLRAIERVAGMLPGLTPHHVALRALRAGLPSVEQELLDAARVLATSPRQDHRHGAQGDPATTVIETPADLSPASTHDAEGL
jgi:hypothetical protein